jgi:hypothetical protein
VGTFRWACTAAIWAVFLVQAWPCLVHGRQPRWFGGRVRAPRRWAAGAGLVGVGSTLGVVSAAWSEGLSWIPVVVVVSGLAVSAWAFHLPSGGTRA